MNLIKSIGKTRLNLIKKYSTLSTNNRLEFAESLVEQHPDVAKVVWRYDRWHHEVNYDLFKKNKLIFKKDYKKKIGVNNYNMKLIKLNK